MNRILDVGIFIFVAAITWTAFSIFTFQQASAVVIIVWLCYIMSYADFDDTGTS